jgi:N6-adenosine-specific RNA methylase IME4
MSFDVILAPVREHSRKPDEFYERVEQFAPGPRLDSFARQRRPGWDAGGDQLNMFPALPDSACDDDYGGLGP